MRSDAAVTAEWQVGDQTDDGYQFWFFDADGGYSRHHPHPRQLRRL